MATLLELAKIKHHAVRSDGAKFLDGVRNDSLNTSWLAVNSAGRVTLAPGLYDELLVVKGEVSDDQIKAWASMGAPFYDPSPQIPDEQIQSAEYWSGPVDASKRPVYTLGAGADIEMDKFGIRATRKADNVETFRVDTETGDVHFEGDGVFRGRVEASEGYFHGEVKSVDADGNYSVLDQARLRFYRRIGNEDVLSYYVAQIATGQAVDGQVVDLAALGYRFFEAPKVVLQPKLNRVFVANTTAQDVWMDWDVEDETFNPQTGAATFRVRARTIVKGGTVFGSFSPNKLTTEGSSTTTTTGPGTTYLRLRLSGYAYRSFILDNANLTFRIRYRKSGTTSWTVLDTRTYTAYMHAELPITNFSYNVPSSGDVGYDVQVTVTKLDNQGNEPRETPHLTIHEFEYRSGDTILSDPANPEIVSWIAIDGG